MCPLKPDLQIRWIQAVQRAGLLFLLLGTAVQPQHAAAQSFEDAVRANLALALSLCVSPTSGPQKAAQFRAAGFGESVERASNGDTTHTFTAPAATVVVEHYYGQTPEACSVRTAHLGVTAASQVLDGLIPQRFPTYVRRVDQGPVNPSTGLPALCARYEDPTSPIGRVIGVVPAGNQQGCVDNGSSAFYDSYRV